MRIPRLYHAGIIAVDSEITLHADTAHHVANVLRLKNGHPVVLFNGDGNEYSATVVLAQRRQVIIEVDSKLAIDPQSSLPLHLGQGVSKGDRMDWVLQKATELGASDITPLITERCPVKLDEKRWQKKFQQWQKIIQGACEQCGRNTLPTLHPVISLQDWLSDSTQQTRLVLAPGSQQRLTQLAANHKGYRLLIGPEGGLSDAEVHQSQEAGYTACSLGPRILRTETAALSGLSILQATFGDI
ncbi:MAG: 16S rRNA (uracil(1498)-N(3))-methyltransferase [Alteromonadaceae bacterium]|nr:16S rRNA (uracil(1498)-N(3))-methyltransferase [Alteromonadaceae bacterium]